MIGIGDDLMKVFFPRGGGEARLVKTKHVQRPFLLCIIFYLASAAFALTEAIVASVSEVSSAPE